MPMRHNDTEVEARIAMRASELRRARLCVVYFTSNSPICTISR